MSAVQNAPKTALDADLGLTAAYIRRLPRGLASYPGCAAKASLVNAYLVSKPLSPASVPSELQMLLQRPPRTNEWIPEVHFLTLALLIREQHFSTDAHFLSWVRDVNAQLFKGPIYRALMLVASTRTLAKGTPLRWRQFHQGTDLVADHGDGAWVDLLFCYEPNLFDALHVRLFLASLEAAITALGESGSHVTSVEVSTSEARARIAWRSSP
jgi:hypothetical protein